MSLGIAGDALGEDLRALLASLGEAAKRKLPRRDLVGPAGLASDREHGRTGLERHRAAASRGIAEEHERPGRRLEVILVDRERRAPGEHDIQLLVPTAPQQFVVLLDHLRARGVGGVCVDPERLDPEVVADGTPDRVDPERREALDLIDVGDCVALWFLWGAHLMREADRIRRAGSYG
jgi:hypothetical protein